MWKGKNQRSHAEQNETTSNNLRDVLISFHMESFQSDWSIEFVQIRLLIGGFKLEVHIQSVTHLN